MKFLIVDCGINNVVTIKNLYLDIFKTDLNNNNIIIIIENLQHFYSTKKISQIDEDK